MNKSHYLIAGLLALVMTACAPAREPLSDCISGREVIQAAANKQFVEGGEITLRIDETIWVTRQTGRRLGSDTKECRAEIYTADPDPQLWADIRYRITRTEAGESVHYSDFSAEQLGVKLYYAGLYKRSF